jgi:hypothetical protein
VINHQIVSAIQILLDSDYDFYDLMILKTNKYYLHAFLLKHSSATNTNHLSYP